MLVVRHSTYDDLNEIEDIFVHARKIMKDNGNPTQWGDDRPGRSPLRRQRSSS